MSIIWQRAVAFVVDTVAIVGIWDVFDNLLLLPIPYPALLLSKLAWICAYYVGTEGWGRRRASLGKRVVGLAVVSGNGEPAPGRAVLGRAGILAVLIDFEWTWLVDTLFPTAPVLWIVVVLAVIAGLTVFSLALLMSSERRMLHDILTGTRVVRTGGEVAPVERAGAAIRFRAVMLPVALVGTFAALLGFYWPILGDTMFLPRDTLPTKQLSDGVLEAAGVRNVVKIETESNWSVSTSGEEANQTTLAVSVWVPWLGLSDDLSARVTEEVVAALTLPAGVYQTVTVRVWTGGLFQKSYNSSFPVNNP